MLQYLAGGGGIALLDVNPGLLIWTTITFFIVFFMLRFFAWKPIAQAIDARADRIHADLERAESIRKEAEAKYEEYLQKLNSLRQEGHDIVQEAKKDAEKLRQEILDTARKEAEAARLRGVREIQLAKDTALEQLHQEVVNLSIAVAGQLIGRNLNAEDHKRFVTDSVKKIRSIN